MAWTFLNKHADDEFIFDNEKRSFEAYTMNFFSSRSFSMILIKMEHQKGVRDAN